MIALTDITGLAGLSFALAALLVPVAVPHAKGRAAWPYVAACFVLALIPFDGPAVASYLRGAFGDLGIATLMLLAMRLHPSAFPRRDRTLLLILLACTGLIFYPLALGLGIFDPYRLGYGNAGLIAALLALALLGWYAKRAAIALWLSLSALAWSTGWYESANLWDYLIDPWAVLYATGALAVSAATKALALIKARSPL